MASNLILVATPIGNLEDISLRAIKALNSCDFIAAEDTRVTVKLLNHLNIKKPMVSYYEHNAYKKTSLIYERILSGETCVLVSDAGMPAISDPGGELVKKCAENNIEVTIIPGPCAAVCALAVSGLDTGRFVFEGFLTVNKKNRLKRLKEIEPEPRTLIFYEAPHKLLKTLKDMYEYLGDRKISIVKELTKIHEEIIRTTLKNAIEIYSEQKSPKGEFVLIIEGRTYDDQEETYTVDETADIIKELMSQGNSLAQASKLTAKKTGLKKSLIYKNFLENE